MDHWLVIMILGIVAISAYSRIQRAKYNAEHGIVSNRRSRRHGAAQTLLDPAQPSPREQELQREVEDLRTRIHVLNASPPMPILRKGAIPTTWPPRLKACATVVVARREGVPAMISESFTIASAALLAVAIIAVASLRGWQGWLSFKTRELDLVTAGRVPEIEGGAGSGMARIEMADLKERIRKLEAIAAGVDL